MNMSYIYPFYFSLTSLLVFAVCSSAQPPVQTDAKMQELTLFNGTSLDNWSKTDYAGKGEIFID